ncbi:MAG: ATPase domain-containing protein [Thermoplasmata archaeon]
MDEIERIPTYIVGFDDHMDGGIPAGHLVLVAGTSGTMKSTVTYYIQYKNALNDGRKCIYVSLEQSISSLLDHMTAFGMDAESVKDKLEIWDLGSIRTDKFTGDLWLNVFKRDIQDYHEKFGMDILVIDSLPALEIVAGFKKPRLELFHFFEWLRSLGLTVLLISEMSRDSKKYSKYDEDFIADGIIHLKMELIGENNVQRRIRCVKMRSTEHSPNFFTLLSSKCKFEVTKVIGEKSDF